MHNDSNTTHGTVTKHSLQSMIEETPWRDGKTIQGRHRRYQRPPNACNMMERAVKEPLENATPDLNKMRKCEIDSNTVSADGESSDDG